MNKSILLSTIIIGTLLSADGLQTQEMSTSEMTKQNKIIVDLASKEISKTLPQKIDNFTTLQRVEGKDNKLVYIYEINTGSKSDETVKKEDKSRMKEAVTYGICRSSKRFLDAQIDIVYLYTSATSKDKLFEFVVKQEDCPKSY